MSLPESGRAAVVTGFGNPLEIREYPVLPPGPGEIVLRIEAATVCGSDVHAWQGRLRSELELPIVPGHEAVGRVVALGIGSDVDSVGQTLAVGDRVVWSHETCGHCYHCTVTGNGALCDNRSINFLRPAAQAPHFHGTFAEYAVVRARSGRLKVSEALDAPVVSAASCALRTVLNAWNKLGAVDFRHHVVILGAGPLGLFATAVAATLSPASITVVGGPDERLAVAKAYGASNTVSIEHTPESADRAELIRTYTEGRGADVVCEFSGGPGAFSDGLRFAALDARYVVSGTVTGGDQSVPVQMVTRKNIRILGSLSANIDSYYAALRFLEAGRQRFDWSLMLGSTSALDETTSALERMKSMQEIKPIITPL